MSEAQSDLGFGRGYSTTMKSAPDLFGPDGKPALSASTDGPVIVDEEATAGPARSESRPAAPSPEPADTVDHDARIAEAERQLAALQSAPPPAAAPAAAVESGPKPRRYDFDDPEAYDAALVEWASRDATHRTLAERDKQAGERSAAERQGRANQAAATLFDARRQKFIADHPDYAEVAEAATLPITETMALTMVNVANGPAVAYWLGQNPKEAARIAGMQQPAMAIYEIGKISARLEAGPAPRQAQPRARRPERPAPEASRQKAPEDMDINEYAAYRAEKLKAERRPMFGGR